LADSGLVRSLRLPQATALVVGTILGASVFVQASELTEHVPRRRAGWAPACRVLGYPWVPVVFVIASVTIVINRLISEPVDSAAGLGLVALGVPAYYLWARRGGREPELQPATVSNDRR
jgi:hypothetical protein